MSEFQTFMDDLAEAKRLAGPPRPMMHPGLAARVLRKTESSQTGEPCTGLVRLTPFGPLRWLGAGVLGVVHQFGGAIVISVLEAITEGSGDVGRYLDRLPTDKLICVAEVLSPRLAGMLERRGFHQSQSPHFPEDWFRFPQENEEQAHG